MTLYTSKVVAQWLCLTERRVRQLRDEGVIVEARPGLYELQPTVARYITYIGGAGKETLTNERMKLTRAKREAAELENELRKGEVHRTEDIERGIKSMFLNIRSRFLALPAKLSPTLATMGGNQTGIFDELKQAGESDGEEAE
jgi:phage terminase Nu1 subunit (DNA packaging protein)